MKLPWTKSEEVVLLHHRCGCVLEQLRHTKLVKGDRRRRICRVDAEATAHYDIPRDCPDCTY